MTLYTGPRDVVSHIRQLEKSCGFSGYDHTRPETSGWRNELENAKRAERRADIQHGSHGASRLLRAIRGWIIRLTGDRQDA